MKLPTFPNFRLIADEFFLRALRRWGILDQILKASSASARLQVLLNQVVSMANIGGMAKIPRTKETELIEAIAEMEIYLSALGNALGAESDIKQAIHSKLAKLRDEALKKEGME